MRGRPPKKALSADQERAASAFVAAAEAPDSGSGRTADSPPGALQTDAEPVELGSGSRSTQATGATGTERPWEAPYVRADVTKGYALRLPEPLYLQLKWVAEQTGRSVNTVCREAIEGEVARHLGP